MIQEDYLQEIIQRAIAAASPFEKKVKQKERIVLGSVEALRYELNRKEAFQEKAKEMERNKAQAFRMLDYDIGPNITRYGDEVSGPGSVETQALRLIFEKESYVRRIEALYRRSNHWKGFKDTLSEDDRQVLDEFANGSRNLKTVTRSKYLLGKYLTKETTTTNKEAIQRLRNEVKKNDNDH